MPDRDREGGKQNIALEIMQKKLQEAAAGLGIELELEPEEKIQADSQAPGSEGKLRWLEQLIEQQKEMDRQSEILGDIIHKERIMQYEALLREEEKKEEELQQEIKEKRKLVEKFEEQITEEEKKYEARVGKKEQE